MSVLFVGRESGATSVSLLKKKAFKAFCLKHKTEKHQPVIEQWQWNYNKVATSKQAYSKKQKASFVMKSLRILDGKRSLKNAALRIWLYN